MSHFSEHQLRELTNLIKDIIMADFNLADGIKAVQASVDKLAASVATIQTPTVDLTPVLTAVQALSDKIDSIDTPTQ